MFGICIFYPGAFPLMTKVTSIHAPNYESVLIAGFPVRLESLVLTRHHRNHAASKCSLLADPVYHGIPELFRIYHG